MTNHVHLLVAPDVIAGLGRFMKRLAGRQTRYHNRLKGHTGTLWESRYKLSPVDSHAYLLACSRYIELNPVRARMVATPAAYRWSSCRYRLGHEPCEWLDHDPCYLALGANDQLTVTGRFVEKVEAILGKGIEHRSRGRPSNVRKDSHEQSVK
jgi:putative transposase